MASEGARDLSERHECPRVLRGLPFLPGTVAQGAWPGPVTLTALGLSEGHLLVS